MAINAAKQLLDELMGRQRNLAPDQTDSSLHWGDPSVCKTYLVNFCPNSLFTNTKADIGPCNLVHDDYLKREYQTKASRRERRSYEDEFIRFCQNQLNEVERKIKRAKQRLEMSQLEKSNLENDSSVLSVENQTKINAMTEKIEKLLEEIEQLGCEGKVEEAQSSMLLVDQLKDERSLIKRENHSGRWIQQKAEIGVAQEKQMEVCDVCGAFLIVNDVQQRVDDHLMGKQHVGYGRLKTALDDLIERRRQERESEDRNRNDRDKDKYKRENRDRFKDRHDERRDREDSRHRGHRSSHDRSNRHTRDRSRSRERHRHSSTNGANK